MPTLTTAQIFRFALNNLDLFEVLSDDAVALAHAGSCVEGWVPIRHAGDVLAPRGDDLIAMIGVRDVTNPDDVRALEGQLLEAYADRPSPRADRPKRDGKWLNAGLELFKLLLPILLAKLGS